MNPGTGTDPLGTHFELSGAERAPIVVLAHGVGLDHLTWEPQMAALTPHFRVLRYDLLGHGKTPHSPDTRSLLNFSRQLEQLLVHLDITQIYLVGFSLGALIAQHFSAMHPGLVRRLVLLSAVYRASDAELAGVRRRLELTEANGISAVVDAAPNRWFSEPFQASHPDVMQAIRRQLLGNDLAGYLAGYRRIVHANEEIGDALRSVSCPTLVMTGELDVGSTPEMARRMERDLSDARVVILEGLKHMAAVESPAAVNEPLVAFLRGSRVKT